MKKTRLRFNRKSETKSCHHPCNKRFKDGYFTVINNNVQELIMINDLTSANRIFNLSVQFFSCEWTVG